VTCWYQEGRQSWLLYINNECVQHTATQCNTLQHTATHCNTLQHTAYKEGLQSWLLYINNECVQRTATHCNTLQHTATHCNTLQHTATHWYKLLDIYNECVSARWSHAEWLLKSYRMTSELTFVYNECVSARSCRTRGWASKKKVVHICVAACCSVLQGVAVCSDWMFTSV